jgi:hypothetical protein
MLNGQQRVVAMKWVVSIVAGPRTCRQWRGAIWQRGSAGGQTGSGKEQQLRGGGGGGGKKLGVINKRNGAH